MPPARSLFQRSDRQKPVRRRWHAVFVRVRAGGAVVSAVVVAPRPDIVFVIVDEATSLPPHPPPWRGGSNDRCVGSSRWRRTIYPPGIQLVLEGCVPLASELQSLGGSTIPSFVCP